MDLAILNHAGPPPKNKPFEMLNFLEKSLKFNMGINKKISVVFGCVWNSKNIDHFSLNHGSLRIISMSIFRVYRGLELGMQLGAATSFHFVSVKTHLCKARISEIVTTVETARCFFSLSGL